MPIGSSLLSWPLLLVAGDARRRGGRRRLRLRVREGDVVPRQRPGHLRQLPRDVRAPRGLAAVLAPRVRHLQRLPHARPPPIGKYVTKATNGYHHSMAFTLGGFPDVIRAPPREPRGRRGPVPPLPRRRRRRDDGGRRGLLHPLPRLRRTPPLNVSPHQGETQMTPETAPKKRGLLLGLVAGAFALAAVLAAALLVNIAEKKSEAKNPTVRVVELTDDTEDPAVWGKNFPVEYDLYKKTTDMVRTKYGGSEAMPAHARRGRTRARSTSQSKTDADPRLKTMWAGYAFAADFREERGHAYTLDDQIFTQRQVVVKQPGTCAQCHASVYVPMKKLGNGDIIEGLRGAQQDAVLRGEAALQAPGRLHRLPRLADDGAARDPPRVHRGHPRVQGLAGRRELRPEHDGDAPGDARVRLRPVPRRVLLQGPGEAAHVPVVEGPEGGPDRSRTTTRSGSATGRTRSPARRR